MPENRSNQSLFPKALHYAGIVSRWTNEIAEWICILCGVGIVVTINLAVISRYILQSAFIWPEEAAIFLMIWITFVGGSVAMKKKALVSFQFVINALPARSLKYIELYIKGAVATFIIWFLIYGKTALEMYKRFTASGTNISLFWPALGLQVGGVFMLIHVIHALFEDISSFNLQTTE